MNLIMILQSPHLVAKFQNFMGVKSVDSASLLEHDDRGAKDKLSASSTTSLHKPIPGNCDINNCKTRDCIRSRVESVKAHKSNSSQDKNSKEGKNNQGTTLYIHETFQTLNL